jgi:VanZ family protein
MTFIGISLYRSLLALTALVILHLATTAHAYPVISSISDKANHVMAFIALSLLHDHAFPRQGRFTKTIALLGYGVAIEAIQWFLPYRESSGLDLVADAVGIGAYWLLAFALGAVLRPRVAV